MLAADFVDQLRFRLAGTRVCALFGREIKGEAFTALWSETSRNRSTTCSPSSPMKRPAPSPASPARTEDGAKTDLELLLLPLAHVGHARIRALGVLAPPNPPYWLGAKPVVELDARHAAPPRTRRGQPACAAS